MMTMKVTEISSALRSKAVNTIRILAAEGVQKANSGHPGLPMGMADCAFVLWTQFLRYNPEDPGWIGRDRFILSAGHGSMLLYTMLYLAGYNMHIDDLKSFRQLGSNTPGHPEIGCLPGVETTTGPLGQGFANGVGMAIASKTTAQRFNTKNNTPFGNDRIFAIVSDGDLMEGIASEAASLAGHLGLDNLVYIYDDNKITIDGSTDLAFSESVQKRFEAYGWSTISIDGHDHAQIAHALQSGIDEGEKPTLIIARSHIGYGSPNKQDTAAVHGAPLGEEELQLTRERLGRGQTGSFFVPPEVEELFENRREELNAYYMEWQNAWNGWKASNRLHAQQWEDGLKGILPENLEEQLLGVCPDKAAATRAISGMVLQKIAEIVPHVYGGSADLHPSNNTYIKASSAINTGDFSGRNMHFGIREHAMGGIMNGMALYGGLIPYGGTFLVFSDYMRPAIRLAALMEKQVIYVFTHDSIFVGEDGPTHQPIEHVTALRTIPNLLVIRPGDAREVALSWATALRRKEGPTALILTRQKLEPYTSDADDTVSNFTRGGYIYRKEESGLPEIVIIATGSELPLAVQAREALHADGLSVRVVSMPSRERFLEQDTAYQNRVIPPQAKGIVVVEAGITAGWGDLTRLPYRTIGIDRFGASGPFDVLAEKFGFTVANLINQIKKFHAGLS